MAHRKYEVGDHVEMYCSHLTPQGPTNGWLAGRVVQVDYRMVAVKLEGQVFASNGWPIPDGILWSAHGSSRLRLRADAPTE